MDYLVVGAGAAGMAFADALIDNADVNVAIIDRRHGAGGHWLDAYPFVQLHQASPFYGVASMLLGDGRIQKSGPEAGWYERAFSSEVCAYYVRALARLNDSGQVRFYPNCEYLGDGRFASLVSGELYEMSNGARIVDASYLSPDIPLHTPAPFGISDGARVISVNELVRLHEAPSQFVIAGSGKTATDACVWLLANGVDPDKICWVRPRDPWMLNRAKVQPDPVVFIGMLAEAMELAAAASTADDLFFRLEEAGIMLRIDPRVNPTMAKTPTLAQWELDELRSIENVVRLGHIQSVAPGSVSLATGEVAIAKDAVVVHCAASGLQYPPLVPVWGRDAIRLQSVQNTFTCFGAALTGYVEAVCDSDEEKNRLCPPCPYPNTPTDWARTQVLANAASVALSARPDIKEWADQTILNPARIPPERATETRLLNIVNQFQAHVDAGIGRLAELSGVA